MTRELRKIQTHLKTVRKKYANSETTMKINSIRNQFKTFRKRWKKSQKRILNKYYSWQHYFTEKKRRFKGQYKATARRAAAFEATLKRLKRLHFMNASPCFKKKKYKKYVLLVTGTDAIRLKTFLRGTHYSNNGRKPGLGLIYLTPKERIRLRYFLQNGNGRNKKKKK